MAKEEDLFAGLEAQLLVYKERFIDPHLPAKPGIEPSSYELDVKAFCLLVHAAFEDYFEKMCLHLMQHAIDAWISSKTLTDTLLILLCHYGGSCAISDKDNQKELAPFDYIRIVAGNVKQRFSKDIYDNHGISPRHLRSILLPVAIEFSPDPNTINSLVKLSLERGEYAHHYIMRSLAPEDADKYVQDCLKLADNVKSQALKKGFK